MEELKFLGDVKEWSNLGTSPGSPVHSTPASPGSTAWGNIPVPPSPLSSSDCSQNTRGKRPLSLVCLQSEADKPKISFFPVILCVIFLSRSPCADSPPEEEEGRAPALSYCLCQSQCTPEFQLGCSKSR